MWRALGERPGIDGEDVGLGGSRGRTGPLTQPQPVPRFSVAIGPLDGRRGLASGLPVSKRCDQERHFSLTTGSSPWSFWRRRVPRQSASALGPHVVHRPSKALEGYSPFKTTDLRDPVLGEIADCQGVTPRSW